MSSYADVEAALPRILSVIPDEWRGTTFKNSNLLGRERFAQNLSALIQSKGDTITTEDLVNLGNAEDYLRVSSNVSSVLEFVLASEMGFDISRVFTFGSTVMPIVAAALTSTTTVHLHAEVNPISPQLLDTLNLLGCKLVIHENVAVAHPGDVVLSTSTNAFSLDFVDGIVSPNTLYIKNPSAIAPPKILTIRKRMSTPMTTPAAEALLQTIAKVPITADAVLVDDARASEFYSHLQQLSGVDVNPASYPVCFTAGLPAICSLWMTLIGHGGADIVMASTSYGGSSELTDLLHTRAGHFNKHTFDITGRNDIATSIETALNTLAADPSALMPRTVLFVEIPTNPDMKVPDIAVLASILDRYKTATSRDVLLLVDTTFAPHSRVLEKMHSVAPDLTAMVFISMSKSVSRGLTTAGTLVAGNSEASCALLERVRQTATALDTTAKRDQLVILSKEHIGVEDRNAKAYQVAVAAGAALRDAVKEHCGGFDMDLAFVKPEHAAAGFTSMTFSFNLPPVPNAAPGVNEGLAQRFVDLLTAHEEFKPCVSFGQDNGLVYATVPATSTQGAIRLEDKAKQAVGGVQLTRLSFPPTCNVETVCKILSDSVKACYQV